MALTLLTKSGKDNAGIVAFQRVYVDYLDGDVLTALLLSQIFYWYRPDEKGKSKLRVFKDGMWWIAKSMVEWHEEVGLTPKQIRRSLEVLEERGIITSQVRTFNRAPTNHTRLIALNGSREVINDPNRALICPFSTPHLPLGTNQTCQKGKSITETTTESTDIQLAIASQGEIGKENSNTSIEVEGKEMADLNDILKKKVEEKSQMQFGLEVEWNKRMSQVYGGFHPNMGMKEKAQLKKIRLVSEAVGLGGAKVVKYTIENWNSVAAEVVGRVGGVKAPSMPHVGWVSMHADHVVDIYKQASEVKPVQLIAQVQKPVTIIAPEVEKVEDKPEQEDIDDAFAFLYAQKAKSGG